MTFGQMIAAVKDDLNLSIQPSTTVDGRIARWLNEGQMDVLSRPGMVGLRQANGLPFTTEANRGSYGLPMAFERIDAIVQQSNDIRLLGRSRDWYRSMDPGDRAFGNPYVWIDDGLIPVSRQPDETGLWVASSSASDTAVEIQAVGITADGDVQEPATATLTGVTRVAIGSLTDYVHIEKLQLMSQAVGIVSVYDAAVAGNVICRIPIGRTGVQFYGIRLWPTPAAALDYKIDGQLLIYDMVNDTDVPMLPDSYHDMLPTYARMREYKKQGDKLRFAAERGEFEEQVARLQSYVEYPNDYRPISSALREDFSWNNLGSAYPGDGWGRG